MRFRKSPEDKEKAQSKRTNKAFIQFMRSNPDGPDLYVALDRVKNLRFREIILKVLLRRGCIDDIFCLAKKEKYCLRAWDGIKLRLESNKHTKIILLEIAGTIPDLAIPALEEIKNLGFELSYEETAHLIALSHIQSNPSLHEELESKHKEEGERMEQREKLLKKIEKEEEKSEELKRAH